MSEGEVPCHHCGLAAPSSNDDGLAFCCAGCRSAYGLMRDVGLDHYYQLRDRLGGGAAPTAVGDDVSLGAYAHFDDAAYLAEHGHEPGCADLHVTGLHCAACVWVIDRLPAVLDGVTASRVDFGTGRLHLEWEPSRIRLSEVARFLHRIGYPTHAFDAAASAERQRRRRAELIRVAVAGACAGNVMLASVSVYAGDHSGMSWEFRRLFELVSLGLSVPAVTYGAWPFFRGAVSGLRVGRLHMDLPISVGLLIGFVASMVAALGGPGRVYFDTVTMLVFLLLLGRFVQQRGQDWAISSGALLHLLLPGTAWRESSDAVTEVPVGTLVAGDRIRVRPGQRFAADGRVIGGEGSVDLSKITGESVPVRVREGDEVLAGTTNLEREIRVEVTTVGSATRIGKLVGRIDAAGQRRAEVVDLTDRIAGGFVAVVLLLAALGGVAWTWIDPSRALDVSVAVLVVSCPCALGLATPSALAVARGRAASQGILLADAAALERLARVTTIVFDKTGTLTEGSMRVGEVVFAPPVAGPAFDSSKLAAVLSVVESTATHPVGRALRSWAAVRSEPNSSPAGGAEEIPGKGVRCRVGDQVIRVGRPGWIAESVLSDDVERMSQAGYSPVLVEIDGAVVAAFAVGDRVRSGISAALDRLRNLGVALALRSGDDVRVTERVGAQLGIADAKGRLEPEDKAEEVAGHPHVAMVGDGVNDAPALRAAAVGIAVGGGAEAALRVADVHLTRPEGVADLIEGARRTLRTIRRNLGFSLTYNVTFAALALAGFIDPLAAAVLMPMSSLTVIASSVFARSFVARPVRQAAT